MTKREGMRVRVRGNKSESEKGNDTKSERELE